MAPRADGPPTSCSQTVPPPARRSKLTSVRKDYVGSGPQAYPTKEWASLAGSVFARVPASEDPGFVTSTSGSFRRGQRHQVGYSRIGPGLNAYPDQSVPTTVDQAARTAESASLAETVSLV